MRSSSSGNVGITSPKRAKMENGPSNFIMKNLTYTGICDLTPYKFCSVIQITREKFILIGAYSTPPHVESEIDYWNLRLSNEENSRIPKMKLFEGILLEDENCLKWNEIDTKYYKLQIFQIANWPVWVYSIVHYHKCALYL